MARGWSRIAAVALVILAAAACDKEPARLVVELEGPATADPLIFHGNCFAGWSVRATLRVRETGGADAHIEAVIYDLRDEGRGKEIIAESLGAASVLDRYGTNLVAAGSSLLFPVGGPVGSRPVGPVVVIGELRGHDEDANALTAPYRLEASSLVVNDPELGSGGACP